MTLIRSASVSATYARRPAGSITSPIGAAPVAPPNDDSFMQYASARRIDRQEQEQAVIDMVLRGPEQSDNLGSRSLTGSLFSAEMLRALSDSRHQQ